MAPKRIKITCFYSVLKVE